MMGWAFVPVGASGYGVWGGEGRGGFVVSGRAKKAKGGSCYCRFCMAWLFSFRLESETYLVVFWVLRGVRVCMGICIGKRVRRKVEAGKI